MLTEADFRNYLHALMVRTFGEYGTLTLAEQEAVRKDFLKACEDEPDMDAGEYFRRIRPATLNSYAATLLVSRNP